MSPIKKCFFLILFILSWNHPLWAKNTQHTVTFSRNDLLVEEVNGYHRITLSDCDLTEQVGKPQLPAYLLRLSMPRGSQVEGFTVTSVSTEAIEGNYWVYPAQPPQPYSRIQDKSKPIDFIPPDQNVYGKNKVVPDEIIIFTGTGHLRQNDIAEFIIHPLRYNPALREIELCTQITFGINYTEIAGIEAKQKWPSSVFKATERALVDNSSKFDRPNLDDQFYLKTASMQYSDYWPYLIITDNDLAPSFKSLADWKNDKGLPAKIAITNEIFSTTDGKDKSEKIKNYIAQAHENWGTEWVLLGGDVNIIPTRLTYSLECDHGGPNNNSNMIPCDLYYADVDNDWDESGNGIHGEPQDNVDLYPDVFIGRASVENLTEADAFVHKVLTYEKNPPLDYQTEILFAAEVLWEQPYTNSGEGKDYLAEQYIPNRFNITRLYQDLGNENAESVITKLNEGVNIFNHDGHAWTNLMSVGHGSLHNGNVSALENGERCGILYTIGCWPGNIEGDCVGERFINNPNGGVVAFIGNSRYGWGSPGNPKYGYSDRFDQQFYHYLFEKNLYHIGQTLAAAKAHFIPYSRQANVYRWCEFEINLLGDPEMPIWTDTPKPFTIQHPESLPLNAEEFLITVLDENQPVEGARVCVLKDDEFYFVGSTGITGQVVCPIAVHSIVDSAQITVTAQNYLPHQSKMAFTSSGPFVSVANYEIDDNSGNGNGEINPGESILMLLCVKNLGDEDASGVSISMHCSSPGISVINDNTDVGDVLSTESANALSALAFVVDSTCKDRDQIVFDLEITDDANHIWSEKLNLNVATPVLVCDAYTVREGANSNGDGNLQPDESALVVFTAKNIGLGATDTAAISFRNLNDFLQDLEYDKNIKLDLSSGVTWSDSFNLNINSSIPNPCFPQLTGIFNPVGGPVKTEILSFGVGSFGLWDDVESANSIWTQRGGRFWHISSRRKHSGSYSWYCGDEETGLYKSYMRASIESHAIILGQNASLSFWAWYDVALFSQWGTRGDGLYVELSFDGGQWEILDFIGTGGALDGRLMGNDWLEYQYDLSEYEAGTLLQVRFKFISDADDNEYEGVYLDDIKISPWSSATPITSVEAISNENIQTQEYALYQNHPNPFNPETRITYQIAKQKTFVSIAIYNLMGQEVVQLVNTVQEPGLHSVIWNGRDMHDRPLPSGIYISKMQADQFVSTQKMILIR